ncbi:MAG: 2-oxoglutarate dehydrogenase complex dihydrolipoyllysine-residue succinyltransferase [Pirellulales bacterium]
MPVELKVPAVGESVTEVQIGQWRKREGDRVERDESVVEIESDKATVDLVAPSAGIVAKMLKKQGETAAVGETIGYLNPPGEAPAGDGQSPAAGATVAVERHPGQTAIGAVQASAEGAAPPAKPSAPPLAAAKAAEKPPAKTAARIMPAAERLMSEHGIDPASVQGTGPGGRVLKEDVQRRIDQSAPVKPRSAPQAEPAALRRPSEAVAEPESRVTTSPPPAPAAPATKLPAEKADLEIGPRYLVEANREEEFIVMSPIRRRIAERLVEAQHTAALLTTFNEIDMSEVMALRAKFKEVYQEKYGVKLGFMSFFVKAVVDALKQVPQVNSEIREPHVVYKNYYDIGIAVGGGKGLVVPILRNAEFLSFAEIEITIGDFARRAAENKIRLDELQGGTFTISNGGVYGSLLSTPIVNPPQSAILGLHAIQDRPVALKGQVVIRPMMYVALTYDHRVVDGREAVTFLKRIKDGIEDPTRLLIEV